ncbi:ClbS/DfsB family four-helix bundle protein [uncultured Treponema sp.]|uniref:ClbS/DfsB family four-helix bundle protein n=1 Tax=uncultured Treponema sp. TaxID=162155 RepID=UPI0026259AA3|nr:ClbS/DfsB family four-helix bundle protein [uncultured Treponema sp.]
MPRPQNKADLIALAEKNYDELLKFIDSMSEDEKNTPFDFSSLNKKEAHWSRDRNVRDVICHLTEWHKLLLKFVAENMKGEKGGKSENKKPAIVYQFLPEPYNWKNYGDMNRAIWQNCQNITIEKALADFSGSHEKVLELARSFSDEELFEKKHFIWTGTTNLGAYFISTTSSHYDWAIKKLKAHRKIVAGK